MVIIFVIDFLQLRRIGKEADIPLKLIFPWLNLIKLILLSFSSSAVVFMIKSLLDLGSGILNLILGGVLFCLFFSILGVMTKILSQQDIKMPFQIMKGIFRNR